MENTFGTSGPGNAGARQQVNLPAILLMVTGGIGIAFALLGFVQSLTGSNAAQLEQIMNDPNVPDQLKSFASVAAGGGIISNILGLAINGFIIFGALKMKNLESRGLALGASIVALIPCLTCYCIGIPVGIWSLVVLNKPEVKSAFR
jgi:uncharacterized membrane protein